MLDIFFWIHWGGMLLAMAISWKLLGALVSEKYLWYARIVVSWAIMAAFITPVAQEYYKQKKAAAERRARYLAAEAVFKEQCKQAGEKIYKTVDNVGGVMLLKVRPGWDSSKYDPMKDPMWPDAAIANEFRKKEYISSFLPYRSKIYDSNGYKFVDVLKEDGTIIRYSGDWNLNDRPFDEEINPDQPARYAITYENNVDPALRQHWVAGTTIQVLDRQNNELLAEKVIFAFEPGLGSTAAARPPWLKTEVCPDEFRSRRTTFLFVNKVLIAKEVPYVH